TPCLFYTSEFVGENVACLYSLAEKRLYNLILPDPPIRSRHLIGSSNGWLVTADEKSELHILNPITVITIEHLELIFENVGAIKEYGLWDPDSETTTHALDKLRDCLYLKAFVFPDPSTGSYIVVLLHDPVGHLSFARVGDCKWILLPGLDYEQCIHMDGLFYAFTRAGRVYTFEFSGPTIMSNIIAHEMENYICGMDVYMYVVQAPWGDLLQVCRKSKVTEELLVQTEKILLYKADMAAKKLVEVNGLHDHVLFLGRSQTQCLNVEDYPQLKKNCVYFTDDETY
ncbi:hypothetical protein ZWY2020_035916, partial [Hordeum vulgare]